MDDITKKIFLNNNIDINEKKELLLLRNIHNKIKNIKNYELEEEKIFKNHNYKNKTILEINRLFSNDSYKKIEKDLNIIINNVNKSIKLNIDNDEFYKKVINQLLKLEIENEIDIKLYKEFFEYYDYKMNMYLSETKKEDNNKNRKRAHK